MAYPAVHFFEIQVDLRDLWSTVKSVVPELGGRRDTDMDKHEKRGTTGGPKHVLK